METDKGKLKHISKVTLPWLQRPIEKINISENQNRRRETGLWSQDRKNLFPYHQTRTELILSLFICPGSSNETTTVIGLQKMGFPADIKQRLRLAYEKLGFPGDSTVRK